MTDAGILSEKASFLSVGWKSIGCHHVITREGAETEE